MSVDPAPSVGVIGYAEPGLGGAPSRRGKGFLAVCATLFLAGLGHLMAGRPQRALFWFGLTVALDAMAVMCAMFRPLLPALVLLVPLLGILAIATYIDAYRTGRGSERGMLRHPVVRYLAGLALIAGAIFASPALGLALLIRSHLIETFTTPSASMAPALDVGDRFLVNKRAGYGRWSIVGHDSLNDRSVKFVKRIVGLPGETVEVVDGEVVINGKIVARPEGVAPYRDPPNVPRYLVVPSRTMLGKDEYFVIGDNSAKSGDSRLWTDAAPGHQRGVIPADYIIGPVTAIYWPPKRWRRFE